MAGLFARILGDTFYWINRRVYWHQLPTPLAFINLIALRINLRRKNLHDTIVSEPVAPAADDYGFDCRRFRTLDGSYNDQSRPAMGMRATRFGRNFPLDSVMPDEAALMEPSPRVIARRLMKRDVFKPATPINLLAAAWLQFQVHDWFSHDNEKKLKRIPLDTGDDWPGGKMEVSSTKWDVPLIPDVPPRPPAALCEQSHWWDASQLYGATKEQQAKLRTGTGGKMKLTDDGRLPADENGFDVTGNNNNWWFGLSVMHTLFVREHNAVCDALAEAYPDWDDDRIFHTARLVIAALIAKIHTIEWTPSLLNTKLLRFGMRSNWFGILGETIRKRVGRLSKNDIISGIMGSPTDHHGVRYAMTEEFVAVYRMHPLMPDDFAIKNAKTGRSLGNYTLTDVAGRGAKQVIDTVGLGNALYHLGTANPGALVLKNYPNALRSLVTQEDKGFTVDLAALDILRDRERGVPRYNKFRELLDMPRIKRFEDLTGDAALAKEIETLYGGDIDKVDNLVGCLAETPPPGFAFSDTAFRIFILMASRRLKSDRFFTKDFTPEIYSEVGVNWVMDTSFADVLRRHFPDIASVIAPDTSPFSPWTGNVG
jgi:hypothetical protein